MGGFECSSHRRRDGKRLDMIDATGHDRFAARDYGALADLGMFTARDGLRWHLIEKDAGRFDFSSVMAQMNGAASADVQVIWDLFHYGYPEHINIFSEDFPKRLADMAAAFALLHVRETGAAPYVVPVNEVSFFSWIAGEIGRFYPFARRRSHEMKRQLISAAIAVIEAVHDVAPGSRTVTSEPAIHVIARQEKPEFDTDAENFRLSQFQVLEMLAGRIAPELGGRPEYIDIIGLNYYPHNQWFYPDREMIPLGDEMYRPLSEILAEIYGRYKRPIFFSETGTEDDERVPWFRYVVSESRLAKEAGVDLNGICLYPILNHPGWADERHCYNGLWDYADENGDREIHEPLARELALAAEVLQPKKPASFAAH